MAAPDRPKLVISVDDLDDAPSPVTAPEPPPAFPAVAGLRPAGAPTAQPPRATTTQGINFGGLQARNLVAAVAGMSVGWLATEVFRITTLTAETEAGQNFYTGIWVAVLGFCFSVVYTGWEHIAARSGPGVVLAVKRAGPWGAGLGFIAGFLANVIYLAFLKQAFESDGSVTFTLYLARILGWGIFGLGVGVTTGALVRAREKMINGAIGGLAGGAAAGLVFEWLTRHVDSATFARLLGVVVVGAGIGFAIGLVETLRRQAWFSIVGGGMAGKEFVLYDGETRVGSSPLCEITLIKDASVQPYHFVITPDAAGARRVLTAYQGSTTTINGAPVAQQQLRNGDLIGAGATTIAYAERTI
jgi:hypothetical protein